MLDNLTKEQKEAVTIIGRDICVNAGAGSGKTRVLVERFVHLVRGCNVPVNDILTITFTEKAANEMKVRIADTFKRYGMKKEQEEVELAYISTIHGFCARLLRENAGEAMVDPQFDILEEFEANRMQEIILNDLLNYWADKERKSFDILLSRLDFHPENRNTARRVPGFSANIMEIYAKIRSVGTRLADIVISESKNGIQFIMPRLCNNIINQIMEIVVFRKTKDMSPSTNKLIDKIIEFQPLIEKVNLGQEGAGLKDEPSPVALLKELVANIKLNVSKDVKALLKGLREDLILLIGLLVEEDSILVKKTVQKLLIEFNDQYSEEKRRRGLLDFSDLEEKAKELLEARHGLRNEIREGFKHILIDEFQDINRLQKSIIDLLRKGKDTFGVGDVKQSIYGFRNAEMDVFLEYQDEVKRDNGGVIYLDQSFRSRPEILAFINLNFTNIWPSKKGKDACPEPVKVEEAEGSRPPLPIWHQGETNKPKSTSDFEYRSLYTSLKFDQKEKPSIELILSVGDDKEAARRAEASKLAERIKEIVENRELTLPHSGNGIDKRLSYADIAILFRSTKDIKIYERELSALDIPYYTFSSSGFFKSREVTDMLNFLKILNNPLDDIAMAGLLRSPFVGLDDDSLFWLSNKRPRHLNANNRLPDLKDPVSPYNNEPSHNIQYPWLIEAVEDVDSISEIRPKAREKIKHFYSLLMGLRSMSGRLAVWRIIDEILARTDYGSNMLLYHNGKRRYANLKKIIQLCKKYEEGTTFNLKDFINIVRDYKFKEIREADAPTEAEEGNVVRLMTIHSAKGLEFPVVIVADLGRENISSRRSIEFSREKGITFKLINPSTMEADKPLSYIELIDELNEKEAQEAKRLLYVAMTRAQEHLILAGCMSKKERNTIIAGEWLNVVLFNLDPAPDLQAMLSGLNNIQSIKADGEKGRYPTNPAHSAASTSPLYPYNPYTDTLTFDNGRGLIRFTFVEDTNERGAPPKKRNILSEFKKEIYSGKKIDINRRWRTLKGDYNPLQSISLTDVETIGREVLTRLETPRIGINCSNYVYTVTEILNYTVCPRLHYLKYRLGLPGNTEQDLLAGVSNYHADPVSSISEYSEIEEGSGLPLADKDDEIPRNRLGVIGHRVFESFYSHNIMDKNTERDRLHELVIKELSLAGINQLELESYTAKIIEWVCKFYASPIGHELVSPKRQIRESPFIFNYHGETIRGQFDLLFWDSNNSMRLLDYKFNNIKRDETTEMATHYEIQMLLYAQAIECIFGNKPDRVILYFLEPDEIVDIDLSEASIKRSIAKLDQFFYAQREATFPSQQARRCIWCEYYEICNSLTR